MTDNVFHHFVTALTEHATPMEDGRLAVRRRDVVDVADRYQIPVPWLVNSAAWRTPRRGYLYLPTVEEMAAHMGRRRGRPAALTLSTITPPAPVAPATPAVITVPTVDPTYERWGAFTELSQLLTSPIFMPVMITGPSGNGKSVLPEQVCATLNRPYVRVNVTKHTDEDDLLGGFRLHGGTTTFVHGPVPTAMTTGAVLNLDEIDLGGPALLCLQPVLEGKPLFLKKTGEVITPAPGFAIVATSNTKGRGDTTGRYMHTMAMNDAMLERFTVLFDMQWPDAKTETAILKNVFAQYEGTGNAYEELAKLLVKFAGITRTNFAEGICADQIATRRLIHICHVAMTLRNVNRAVALTLSRFETVTADAFMHLWNAISPESMTLPTLE